MDRPAPLAAVGLYLVCAKLYHRFTSVRSTIFKKICTATVTVLFDAVTALFDVVMALFDVVTVLFDAVAALFDAVTALFDAVAALFDAVTTLFDEVVHTSSIKNRSIDFLKNLMPYLCGFCEGSASIKATF